MVQEDRVPENETMAFQVPGRLVAGRYLLTRELGRGGTGIVWLAEDQRTGHHVAVRELRPLRGLAEEELVVFRQRALQEATSAARIRHSGAVALYDVLPATAADDAVYLITEFIDGTTLAEAIRRAGPLPPDRVADYGLQLLDVLDAAHALGITHRDVKPANIMITPDGQAKLTDFGIAHITSGTRLTRSGVPGTQAYIAPELFDSQPITPAADLWSLGATLYAATEGRAPFDRGATAATLRAILIDDIPAPACPPALAAAITSLLHRDPTRRATITQTRTRLQQATRPPEAQQSTGQSASTVTADASGPATGWLGSWEQAKTTLSSSSQSVPVQQRARQDPPTSNAPRRAPWIAGVFVGLGMLVAGVVLSLLKHSGDESLYGPILLFVGFFWTLRTLMVLASRYSRRPAARPSPGQLPAGEQAEFEWIGEWKGLSAVFMGSRKRQALAAGRRPGVLVLGWGIRLTDWEDEVSIRWEDITELRKNVVRQKIRSTYQMYYSYKLQLASGRSKGFGGMLGESLDRSSRATRLARMPGVTTPVTIEQIGRLLEAGVTRVQLSKALEHLNAGQPVSFGPLTVSLHDITAEGKLLPWSEIQDVKTSRGFVSVKKAGKRLDWTSVPVRKIPNYCVFDALVRTILAQRPSEPSR